MSDRDLVERMAREQCREFGRDPDQLVPETGYRDARMVPLWWKEIEWAKRYIAAHRVLAEPLSPQPPEAA